MKIMCTSRTVKCMCKSNESHRDAINTVMNIIFSGEMSFSCTSYIDKEYNDNPWVVNDCHGTNNICHFNYYI